MNNKFLLINLLLGVFVFMPMAALADEIPVAVFSDDGKTMTFTYADEAKVDSKTTFKLGDWTNKADIDTLVEKVVFDQPFAKARPTSTAFWFSDFTKLTSIEGLENLNTSEVTNMRTMFWFCKSITKLDLSNFNTENVHDMSEMFVGCSSLKRLGIRSFKTDNVEYTQRMFEGCSSLTSLEVTGFNTGKVLSMWGMFSGCSSLTTLDVSGFNTENVTEMNYMFSGCSKLASLDVSGFNTAKVTNMRGMFKGCSSIKNIDVSHFNTENVSEMTEMFNDCSSLTSINVSNFKTDNVTSIGWMFKGCSLLTTLDVSNFNTEKVTNITYFLNFTFSDKKSSLTELNLGNNSFQNVKYGVSVTESDSRTFDGVGSPENPCHLTIGSDFDKSVLGEVKNKDGHSYYEWLYGCFDVNLATTASTLDNGIYLNNMEARTGKQVTLSFRLKNSVKIRGFQFDLHLPDGFSVAKKANGQDSIAMSTARDAKDNIDYLGSRMQTTRANVYRVLATSMKNLSVAEGDDEILTLTLDVADSLTDGNYALNIDSIQMVDDDLNSINLDDITLRTLIDVKTYTLGDVNNDGRVNVSDFTVVANYILGDRSDGFVAKAADLNGDGRINVSDLATLASMVLGDGSSSARSARFKAPRKANNNDTYIDPSTLDNVVYLNDVEATAGKQVKLTYRLKNSVAMLGFQFDLHLPDGFSVAKKANGQNDVTLSSARYANDNFDYLGSNMRTKDTFRVLTASTKKLFVQPGDDDIVTVVINVADSLAAGDYYLLTDSVQMADGTLYGINLDDMTFRTVVKVEQSFDGVVLDENSTTAPVASDGDVNVKTKLTIKGGEWTTICLPFAMTGEQVAEAFGNDVLLADYTGWEDSYASDDDEDPESITVDFTRVAVSEGMKANHPYAIKTTKDISEFVVSNVAVSPEAEPSVSTGSRRKGTLGSFTGSYVADFTVPAQSLYLDGGKFVYSTGDTKLKAFHAYFDFQGVTTSYGSDVSNVSSSFGEPTGIKGISNAETRQNVYSIGGVLVSKNGMKNLPKGIYIRNGKKIVVK